jgi:hypothetical protein
MRNACKILVGKPIGAILLSRPRNKNENNMEKNVKEIG